MVHFSCRVSAVCKEETLFYPMRPWGVHNWNRYIENIGKQYRRGSFHAYLIYIKLFLRLCRKYMMGQRTCGSHDNANMEDVVSEIWGDGNLCICGRISNCIFKPLIAEFLHKSALPESNCTVHIWPSPSSYVAIQYDHVIIKTCLED